MPGKGVSDGPATFLDRLGPDDVAGTRDDDPRLGVGSVCIDAGDNARLPADVDDVDFDGDVAELLPLDFAGLPRRIDDPATADTGAGDPPLVDTGAYERP